MKRVLKEIWRRWECNVEA